MVWSTAYSRTQQDLFVSVSQVCLHQNYFSFLIFGTQWATCHSNKLVTNHSFWTGWATSCSNTMKGQMVLCLLENFCKILCFCNRILLLWQVAWDQISLNLCGLSQSVAVTCWCDLPPSLCLPLNSSFSQLCSVMYKLTFCQEKDFFI